MKDGPEEGGGQDGGQGAGALNLIKLCVGADTVEDLESWQKGRIAERRRAGLDPRPRHVTRMFPRRADELLAGGSLYWVIKGLILVRQKIEALEPVTDEEGIRRCAILFRPELIRTEARPRGPFQGWRYLKGGDAPADLSAARAADALPPELETTLSVLGLGRG